MVSANQGRSATSFQAEAERETSTLRAKYVLVVQRAKHAMRMPC